MLPWSHWFWAGLCLLVLAALGACTPPPPPPLVLGLGPRVGYDPFIVARESGLVDAARVKVVELSTNAEGVRHFRNGLLDAAALTLDQALLLASQGIDLRVVAVLDESSGADVVMAGPSVASAAGLRGLPVLLEPSTVSTLVLRSLLQAGQLQPGDIHVVPMQASQHLAALREGRAVAAVSYEPLATQLRQAGFSPVFDSRQMPGHILGVLVVRSDVLARRGGDVDELMRAWAVGLERLQADTQAAAHWLAPSLQMSADEYQETLKGLRFMTPADSLAYLSGVQPALRQRAQMLAETLAGLGQLAPGAADWGRLIDRGPAARAVQIGRQP